MITYNKLKSFQSELKNYPTVAELLVVKIFQKHNIKFKTQQRIPPYIVDFYLSSRGLIIEIDGSIHNTNRQKERDYKREDYLMSIGLFVHRFNNNTHESEIMKIVNLYPIISEEKKLLISKRIGRLHSISQKSDMFTKKFNDFRDLLVMNCNSNKEAGGILKNSYKNII